MKRLLKLGAAVGMLLIIPGCYYYGPAGAYYDSYYPSAGVSYGGYGYWPYSYYSYQPYFSYNHWPHHY